MGTKLTFGELSTLLDPLYALNLAKEEFGPRFTAILRSAGWSERAFWAEENARAGVNSNGKGVY